MSRTGITTHKAVLYKQPYLLPRSLSPQLTRSSLCATSTARSDSEETPRKEKQTFPRAEVTQASAQGHGLPSLETAVPEGGAKVGRLAESDTRWVWSETRFWV